MLRDRGAQAVVGPIGGRAGTGDARITENEVCVGVDIARVERDSTGLFRQRLAFLQREDDAVLARLQREREPACAVGGFTPALPVST